MNIWMAPRYPWVVLGPGGVMRSKHRLMRCALESAVLSGAGARVAYADGLHLAWRNDGAPPPAAAECIARAKGSILRSMALRRAFERGALGKYANIATPGDSPGKIGESGK